MKPKTLTRKFSGCKRVLSAVCLLLTGLLAFVSVQAEEPHPGRALYAKHCASCHGNKGEGVESLYPQPLVGDLSLKELTTYIDTAMPEDEPELCVGEDAAAVAEYIHNEFYSVIAQVRNQPPQIDLSRLTVRQYRNSLTDLAESFTWQGRWDEKRGLEAKYYTTRQRNKDTLKIERHDPAVNFQFGEGSPDTETISKEEFTIEWVGGVLAPDTGFYEIVLETENAGQLWLNDQRQPLIDARVKSGDQTEYRESVYLLGGRVYPIRISYLKNKTEPTASVKLKWKRPHGTEEVIANRYLSPNRFNTLILVQADFPPDDKSVGYERGVAISKEWNDATTNGAIEFTEKFMSRIHDYAKLPKETDQHTEKLKAFCVEFVGRAFRRPLSEDLKDFFVERQFARVADPFQATRRVILLTLKSPRFLFPGAAAEQFDDQRVAEWLALTLWDSLPDEQLRRAALENKLNTPEQIRSQAQRMVQHLKAKTKLQTFFQQWLNYDHYQELSKSSGSYPGFDKPLVADLRTSLDLFLEEVLGSETADYRQLLLADSMYMNGRLGQFYGVDLPEDADFQKVVFEPEQRAGILSHPYLMAGLAYDDVSSPIHRGVFLARSLLGRFLKPPPIAIAPEPADLNPDMTTRERVERQTAAVTCNACHKLINPLGFSLEHFDAVGRFREQDRDKPVDPTGVYVDRAGEPHPLQGARSLAEFLVNSSEAHGAFTEQLFQHLTKQPVQAFGQEMHPLLLQEFRDQNYHVQKLLASIATRSVLEARERVRFHETNTVKVD